MILNDERNYMGASGTLGEMSENFSFKKIATADDVTSLMYGTLWQWDFSHALQQITSKLR